MERLKHGLTQGESEGDKEYLYKRGTIRAGQALTQKTEVRKQRIVTLNHDHSGDNARYVSVFFPAPL